MCSSSRLAAHLMGERIASLTTHKQTQAPPAARRHGMARLSCCAATALSLLLLTSPSHVHAAKTAPNPFKPGNTLECACSDVDPRTYFTKVGRTTKRCERG